MIGDAGAGSRNTTSQVAFTLNFLQKKTPDPAASTVLTHFHVEIGKGAVVVEEEAAGCYDLTFEFCDILSDGFGGMGEDLIAGLPATNEDIGNSEIGS